MMRLVYINSVAISELKVASLTLFCKDNQIFGSRKKKKAAICELILARKADFEKEGAGVLIDIKQEKKERLSRI